MKKVLPLVCLPLLCLLWLAGCDESLPTAPAATATELQTASVGPSGRPAWVRAYAHIAQGQSGYDVTYGYNVDQVVEQTPDQGAAEFCVGLDPSVDVEPLSEGEAPPAAVLVTPTVPGTVVGVDWWDPGSWSGDTWCIHVVLQEPVPEFNIAVF